MDADRFCGWHHLGCDVSQVDHIEICVDSIENSIVHHYDSIEIVHKIPIVTDCCNNFHISDCFEVNTMFLLKETLEYRAKNGHTYKLVSTLSGVILVKKTKTSKWINDNTTSCHGSRISNTLERLNPSWLLNKNVR